MESQNNRTNGQWDVLFNENIKKYEENETLRMKLEQLQQQITEQRKKNYQKHVQLSSLLKEKSNEKVCNFCVIIKFFHIFCCLNSGIAN